jgi:hypothetical protein
VIDGVTEAMTLQGLELGGNTETAQWRALLPRRVAAATGAAVLEIDHVVKDRESRGRGPIGAQHKLAGLDVAYKVDVIEPLARGRTGVVKVVVEKDRHGHVRALGKANTVAEVHVASNHEGVTVELRPPAAESGDQWQPTHLMEKVSRVIEASSSSGLSKRKIREAVTGRAQFVEQALEALLAGGFVRVEPGPHGARLHFSNRPYREDDEAERVPGVPPCPAGVPDTVRPAEPTVSRVPSLIGDTDAVAVTATEDELAEGDRVLEKFGEGRPS